MLTEARLKIIAKDMNVKADQLSKTMEHNDWFPCGSAHLQVSGHSPLVKLLKKTPVAPFRIMKDTRGYWVMIQHRMNDAFECQSLKYSKAIYGELQHLLAMEGIESVIDSYID